MAQIRFKGFQTGSPVTLSDVRVGSDSASVAVGAFQKPAAISGLPFIADTNDSGTLVPNDGGLTVTTRIWRIVGGAVQGNGATLSAAGLANQYIEYSPDNGTTWSPPLRVYPTSMMGSPMEASHIADDTAVLALVPHSEATHIAVADGAWSNPATWNTGEVPRNGAVVLVPHLRTVLYDWDEPVRLDRLRVDGQLDWPVDASTQMLVETVVFTRGATRTMGTGPSNRVQDGVTHTITISGKDYSANSYTPTDMKASNFSATRGWGRGIIHMGTDVIWGRKATSRVKSSEPVAAGTTSLTVDADLAGIQAGHKILISGMNVQYTYEFVPHSPEYEYEIRTLTSVSGRTLSWAEPLENDHGNPLITSTRTDISPTIMFLGTKNVVQQSEVMFPVWRRGHYANMHHAASPDVWGLEARNMGRTDKSRPTGVQDGAGDFDSRDKVDRTQVTLTPQSNLQGRYPFHAHHLPMMENDSIYAECHGDGSPGWMFVHHGCRTEMHSNTGINWYSGFMVAEQGNELGAWTDNYGAASSWVSALHGGSEYDSLDVNYKTLEGAQGVGGDPFRHGSAYGFRSRALQANRNWCSDCPMDSSFNTRTLAPGANVVPLLKNVRSEVDLQTVGLMMEDIWDNTSRTSDYPITHFADNEARGVVQGVSVVKPLWIQNHDYGVRFKRYKSYGYRNYAFEVEYIDKYMIEDVDAVSSEYSKTTSSGVMIGANAYAAGYVNARVEGGNYAFLVDRSDLTNVNDNYTPEDPRYFLPGLEAINTQNRFGIFGTLTGGNVKTFEQTAFLDDDWNDDLIDPSADPSDTYPRVLGDWDGSTMSNKVTNADGKKVDNLSALGEILPTPLETEAYLPDFNGSGFYNVNYNRWLLTYGYRQLGGENVLAIPLIISDRLTARPAKGIKLIRYTGSTAAYTNNGPITFGSPVVRPDMTATCAVNGSVTIDIVSGATGGDGSTYEIDEVDTPQADHGRYTVNNATGEITYTPFIGFEGLDELYVFLKSGNMWKTVRIAMYVGTLSGMVDPTTADFSVSDGGGRTINVVLSDKPNHGGRDVRRVEYSTDGGATWRRLCHRWIKATHSIDAESDGSALSTGNTNLRIRYKTYYDFSTSGASADRSVTVT